MINLNNTARLLIVLWGTWLSSVAFAQEADYKALTDAAVEEHSLGHFEEARALFAKAHALNPNARTLWGMGAAAFEARQYVDAIGLLEAALQDSRKPLTAAQKKQAESLLRRSQDFVTRLRVRIQPKSARLTVDGRGVERGQTEIIMLDPGTHHIAAYAEGHEEWERAMRWEAGHALLDIVLRPSGKGGQDEARMATSSQDPTPPDASGRAAQPAGPLRTLKWVSLGSTIAALGVAGAGIGLRQRAVHAWNDDVKCPEPKSGSCSKIRATIAKWELMGIAAAATAGVFAALTTTFFLLDRPKAGKTSALTTTCAPFAAQAGVLCAFRY